MRYENSVVPVRAAWSSPFVRWQGRRPTRTGSSWPGGVDGPLARVLASGFARVEPGTMPKAPVPSAREALADAGARGIVELLHSLEERGGGRGLVAGCAAGDTGAAVVVEVAG